MSRRTGIGIFLGIFLLLPWSARCQVNVYVGPHRDIQRSHEVLNGAKTYFYSLDVGLLFRL